MNSRRPIRGWRPANQFWPPTLTASRPLAPHNSNRAFRHGFALSVTIKSLSWSPDVEKFTHCTAIARRVNSAEARQRGGLRLVLVRHQGVSSRSRKAFEGRHYPDENEFSWQRGAAKVRHGRRGVFKCSI